MSGFPSFPSVVKNGEPVDVSQLQHLHTEAADALVWFGGAIVIPDTVNGGYKLCDAAASVLKGIGVAHFNGKLLNARMGTLFLPPARVIVKYTQAAALKVGQMVKTRTDATFEGTALQTDGFAQVEGKWTQTGGGTVDLQTDVVQNEYAVLRLTDARG
jgi:hypothetical protein